MLEHRSPLGSSMLVCNANVDSNGWGGGQSLWGPRGGGVELWELSSPGFRVSEPLTDHNPP